MIEDKVEDKEFSHLVQVPCKFCNGTGKLYVTKSMMCDAGIFGMREWQETCTYCFGDCYTIEQEQKI